MILLKFTHGVIKNNCNNYEVKQHIEILDLPTNYRLQRTTGKIEVNNHPANTAVTCGQEIVGLLN